MNSANAESILRFFDGLHLELRRLLVVLNDEGIFDQSFKIKIVS